MTLLIEGEAPEKGGLGDLLCVSESQKEDIACGGVAQRAEEIWGSGGDEGGLWDQLMRMLVVWKRERCSACLQHCSLGWCLLRGNWEVASEL